MVKSVSYSSEENKTEKKLEETIIDASVKVQNVLLFDHIYNTLESKLLPYILTINETTTKEDIKSTSIVKITGYVIIEDYEHLSYLMSNFNDIGLALATLQLMNKSNVTRQSNNSIEKHAKDNGLNLDKKFTESMVKIIENLHGNSMEITIQADDTKLDIDFKALLNEEYLRWSPNVIRSLYGYKPCMKWTMVGEVTNISYLPNKYSEKTKGNFSEMFKCLDQVDHAFSETSKNSSNTIKIAPIAVYIEHT